MGNLAPPVRNAAIEILLQSLLHKFQITPYHHETLAPQCEICPLPLPILTPVGLDVIGKSGKFVSKVFLFVLFFLQ
jgi:hypothetical protein